MDASAPCTWAACAACAKASASGVLSTRMVKTVCAAPAGKPGTGMKVWRSVRHQVWAAMLRPSSPAGQRAGSTRSGWACRRGWAVKVQTKRSQRCGPVTSWISCGAAPVISRLSATGACTSVKWRPSLCSGAHSDGSATASQGRVPVALSSTAKSSAKAKHNKAVRRQAGGRLRSRVPISGQSVPMLCGWSSASSAQPSQGAASCAASSRMAWGCSAAAWACRAASAGPTSNPGWHNRACSR